MSFPRPDEDKIILNIIWGYFSGMITQEQMLDLLKKMDHSFKHLFDEEKKPKKK